MRFFNIRLTRNADTVASIIRQPDYSGKLVVMYTANNGEGIVIDLMEAAQFQASIIGETTDVPSNLYHRLVRINEVFPKGPWVAGV